MWLFYVDEYGNDVMQVDQTAASPTLKQGVPEWFILAAVGIPAHSRSTLAEQLRVTKARACPDWEQRPWKDTEIKGRDLRQGMERLERGAPPLRPSGFRTLNKKSMRWLCRDLGWAFRKYRPIIYVIAIDKRALVTRENAFQPVAIAYTFLQQRLALLVEQILGPSEGAVIVADEQTGHESSFRKGMFHHVRDALSRQLTTKPNFELLLDKPVWVNAHLSVVDRELLQLPDIVAYSSAAACMSGSAPVGIHYVWEPTSACMALNWRTHKVPGGGFTIYPKPEAYPKGV